MSEYIISIPDDLKDFDEVFVGDVRKGKRLTRCNDCEHWNRQDGTFPDFDGKEWHKCKLLESFKDKDHDSPMTVSWYYCLFAERKAE